jgi:hypothetical protein
MSLTLAVPSGAGNAFASNDAPLGSYAPTTTRSMASALAFPAAWTGLRPIPPSPFPTDTAALSLEGSPGPTTDGHNDDDAWQGSACRCRALSPPCRRPSPSPALVPALESRAEFPTGVACEEVAIRAASVVAVEHVAAALRADGRAGVCSVLVDFFLWDLAKRIEEGEDRVEGIKTQPMLCL